MFCAFVVSPIAWPSRSPSPFAASVIVNGAVHEPFAVATIVHTLGSALSHVHPLSTLQPVQPSLFVVLPSSQSSVPSSDPLPQSTPPSVWHCDEQPSPLAVLPSSHSSVPLITLSPHTGPDDSLRHVAEQP